MLIPYVSQYLSQKEFAVKLRKIDKVAFYLKLREINKVYIKA